MTRQRCNQQLLLASLLALACLLAACAGGNGAATATGGVATPELPATMAPTSTLVGVTPGSTSAAARRTAAALQHTVEAQAIATLTALAGEAATAAAARATGVAQTRLAATANAPTPTPAATPTIDDSPQTLLLADDAGDEGFGCGQADGLRVTLPPLLEIGRAAIEREPGQLAFSLDWPAVTDLAAELEAEGQPFSAGFIIANLSDAPGPWPAGLSIARLSWAVGAPTPEYWRLAGAGPQPHTAPAPEMTVEGNRLIVRFDFADDRPLSQGLRIAGYASLGSGSEQRCDYVAMVGSPPLPLGLESAETLVLHLPDPLQDWQSCATAGAATDITSQLDINMLTLRSAGEQRALEFSFGDADLTAAISTLTNPAELIVWAYDPSLPADPQAVRGAPTVNGWLMVELTIENEPALRLYRDGSWAEVPEAGATLLVDDHDLTLTLPDEAAAALGPPGTTLVGGGVYLLAGPGGSDACDWVGPLPLP
jgi:hypothetical protein